MLKSLRCLPALVALAALCHGRAPATDEPKPVVASPAARHTFDSVRRAPDGRVQYLFTTQNAGVTNAVFMGGYLGGRQLLGCEPTKRTLTLSGSGGGGNELSLAVGGSFAPSAASTAAETAGSDVVASCATPPHNAAEKTVFLAASTPVIHLGSRGVSATTLSGAGGISAGSVSAGSFSLGAPVRRVVVSRDEGGGTGAVGVKPNEYFFGTQYMFPTRFEVGTYTTTGANGGIVSVPYVIPRDFRVRTHGVRGENK